MRLHHLTHNISRVRMNETLRFYADLLGFKRVPATEDPEGERLIWFQIGDHQLHLSIRASADTATSRHFALIVDAFEDLVARLDEAGVRIDRWDGDSLWRQRHDGSRSAFCYDPDGNRIELMGLPTP
jgi:catechol 2,3-dioxygenase-like lactoylglutathione lyase family enzyme